MKDEKELSKDSIKEETGTGSLVKGVSGPMGGRPKKMLNPAKLKATLKALRIK